MNDIKAIGDFDTKKHIYLVVTKKGGKEHLEAQQIGWLGRIWMWLGWSNASMHKVLDYIVRNNQPLVLPTDLCDKLTTRIMKYKSRHKVANFETLQRLIIPSNKSQSQQGKSIPSFEKTFSGDPRIEVPKVQLIEGDKVTPITLIKDEKKATFGPTLKRQVNSSTSFEKPISGNSPFVESKIQLVEDDQGSSAKVSGNGPINKKGAKPVWSYHLQDVSPKDHTILFNGRQWQCAGSVNISDWIKGDWIELKEDMKADKGWYLVKNKRVKETIYFSPAGAAKPTIGGTQTTLLKTIWTDVIRDAEGNTLFFNNRKPVTITVTGHSKWEAGDQLAMMRDGNMKYLWNKTKNERLNVYI